MDFYICYLSEKHFPDFFHIAFFSSLIILSHWDDSIGLHVKEELIRVVDRSRTKPVTLHRGFSCNFKALLLQDYDWGPLALCQSVNICLNLKYLLLFTCFSFMPIYSVQFSRSVMSDSLRPHESQHARPPCPSATPGVHSDSRSSSQWCHPAILSSVVPFFSCPQSLPASESFPMSQLFTSGGQSTGVSPLASFLPKNTQDWSPSEWTGWISLQSKGLSRVFSNTTVQTHQFFSTQLSSQSNSHIHTWLLEKP